MDNGKRVVDVCNERGKELRNRYDEILNKKTLLARELEKLDEEIIEMRKKDVDNVMEYIRTYDLSKKDIDTLLCHCQNMLNGNIDGVYLTFKIEEVKVK